MTVETEQSVKGRATDKIDVQIHSEPSLKKDYVGEITLRVSELPALKPRVLPTRSRSAWRRFIEAGQRRTFTLTKIGSSALACKLPEFWCVAAVRHPVVSLGCT